MYRFSVTAFLFSLVLFAACKHDVQPPAAPVDGNYPPEIAKIILTRCATAGCHNAASYQGAGGLRLDTWENMFNGGSNGAAVVAYNAENSSLLYFINTDASLGPVAQPTMPYNGGTLSKTDYMTIRNWIAAGAPDKNGNIPFASNPDTRQKTYLTQQGCDLLAVIDNEKKVVMRYIPIGTSPAIESPHCVRVAEDGMNAYVSFSSGTSPYVQRIDTRTDKVVDSVYVGFGSWNVFGLSSDSKKMLLSNWMANGNMVLLNTNPLSVITTIGSINDFYYPHGVAANAAFDTFFVTGQYGNFVHKFSLNGGSIERISIDGDPVTTNHVRDPHEIIMSPDHSKYFLTCEVSNEVRVMDAHADTLIKAIPVGVFPQELAISRSKPYVLVTCMEDSSAYPGFRGSVYVINYNTLEATRVDGKFYQPHGITVDDKNGTFFVSSRNSNPNGPAPHHSSSCSGRNGWYNIYNLSTLQPADSRRFEVTVDPYSADTRFK